MTHLGSGLHCTQCAAAGARRALLTSNISTLQRQQHTDAHRASLDRHEDHCGHAARHRCTQSIVRHFAFKPRGAGCMTQMLKSIKATGIRAALHGCTAQVHTASWRSAFGSIGQPRRPEESALVQAGLGTCACAFASDLAAPERHLFRRSLAHACVHFSARCDSIASLSNLKSARSGALRLHTRCVRGRDAC